MLPTAGAPLVYRVSASVPAVCVWSGWGGRGYILVCFPTPLSGDKDCGETHWGRGHVGVNKVELGEERVSPWGAHGDRVGGWHAGFGGGQREILQAYSRFVLWSLG